MIRQIKEYEVEENGVKYKVTEFSNGAKVKASIADNEADESGNYMQDEQKLSDYEQMQLETSANVEYLVALAELNNQL